MIVYASLDDASRRIKMNQDSQIHPKKGTLTFRLIHLLQLPGRRHP